MQSTQTQLAPTQNQQQQQQQLQPPPPPPPPQQQKHAGLHSVMSGTPSVAIGGGVEEQMSSLGKKTSVGRVPSASQSGMLIGVAGNESDNRSSSVAGIFIFIL